MCHTSAIEICTWRELREARSRRAIEFDIERGDLVRLRRGIYAASTACTEAREAAEHGGSLGRETAARHRGIWVLDDVGVHIWLRGHRHHHGESSKECSCVRHWDSGPSRGAFALPSVPRTLLQIYRCKGAESFFVALESARRLGLISRSGLRWLRETIGHVGRDLIDFSRTDADSGLESLVRLRLRKYGWTVGTQVPVVGTGHVDLLIDGWLIVETDGKENHEEESLRHRDLVRDATAAAWGHATLRFDYAMVIHDWDVVERAIVATMARRPV